MKKETKEVKPTLGLKNVMPIMQIPAVLINPPKPDTGDKPAPKQDAPKGGSKGSK